MHVPDAVDHLVWGGADLDAEVERLERLLGVRAAVGGRHPGRGTHNAVIGLGPETYLEIITPDASQPEPEGPRPFGLDSLDTPRLVAWSVRASDLAARARRARAAGLPLGPVSEMSRRRADGTLLEWTLTALPTDAVRPAIPFLIDWGRTPHPAATAPPGCRLVALSGTDPDAGRWRPLLASIGVRLTLEEGPGGLAALVRGPAGPVALR